MGAMEIPTFELLDFLVANTEKCDYDLAQSNLPGLSLNELGPFEETDLSWGYPEGSPELRSLIARTYGVAEDQVLVTQGASEANFLVGLSLLEWGAEVVVERPFYEPLWKVFHLLGVRPSDLHRKFEDDFAVDLDRLRESLHGNVGLVVLTNLYNPGGTFIDEDVLAAMAEIAEERGFYILMDEIFREAAFEKAPTSAATVSDRFIVTSSPSKFYGLGGLRIGWCLASRDILRKLEAAKNFTSVAASKLSDALAVRALRMRERIVERNRSLLDKNRKLVEEWVEEQSRIEWVPPVGHTCFPRFQGSVDRLVSIALDRHGTLIAPGRFFGDERHFRMCFGMATPELEAGLKGLAKALKES